MGWPGPMTHRQYLAWQDWLALEWNRPSRSDHYQMQTAYEIRYVMSKTRPATLDPLRIKFTERVEPKRSALTEEQSAAQSKAFWLAGVGLKGVQP